MARQDLTDEAIRPVYPLTGGEQPILLYSGPLSARLVSNHSVQQYDGQGRVLFRLAPEPSVPWEVIAEPIDLPVATDEPIVEELVVPKFSALRFPDPLEKCMITDVPEIGGNYVEFGGGLELTPIGNPDMIYEMRYHLIGFPLRLGTTLVSYPDGCRRPGRISFKPSGWDIDIDTWVDLDRMQRCAPGAIPFRFMRVCRVRKSDESPFSATDGDVKFLQFALASFLSFVTGRLVGIALPVGLDESGAPKYVEWSSTLFDPIIEFKSWYPESIPTCLEGLFDQFVQRVQEPLWQKALPELIRLYVASNALWKDFAVGCTTACAAIESLAWTILVQEQQGMTSKEYDSLEAAERCARLLEWAGIPTAVPRDMKALRVLAEQKSMDASRVIFWIRNRIVHPDKKSELSPSPVREAWKISLWYVELVLLKLLGYSSDVKSRVRSSTGITDLDRVPWAPGESE